MRLRVINPNIILQKILNHYRHDIDQLLLLLSRSIFRARHPHNALTIPSNPYFCFTTKGRHSHCSSKHPNSSRTRSIAHTSVECGITKYDPRKLISYLQPSRYKDDSRQMCFISHWVKKYQQTTFLFALKTKLGSPLLLGVRTSLISAVPVAATL